MSKMFVPKGTGGVESNLKTQQQILNESHANTAAPRNAFASYMGSGNMSSLPSWMQTPDWQQTQGQVYNAFNSLGNQTLGQTYQQDRAALNSDRLRSGMMRGSTASDMSLADLTNWYNQQKAQTQANALMQSLGVGQNLRGEAGTNYWNMLNFLGDTSSANAFGNIANQYGQIGANQMSAIGGLLGAAGSMAGSNPQWFSRPSGVSSNAGGTTIVGQKDFPAAVDLIDQSPRARVFGVSIADKTRNHPRWMQRVQSDRGHIVATKNPSVPIAPADRPRFQERFEIVGRRVVVGLLGDQITLDTFGKKIPITDQRERQPAQRGGDNFSATAKDDVA